MDRPLTVEEAAEALGESEQLTAWLIENGRLPNPPTLTGLRAYRQGKALERSEFRGNGRIEPGTLSHLYQPGVVTVSTGVPRETVDRIDQRAAERDMTRAAWIAEVIDKALDS